MRKIKKSILLYISKLYKFYLSHKWFRILVWFLFIDWVFAPLNRGSYFHFILRLIFFLLYRSHCVFPVKHSKVIDIVIGVPGSGKTSLAAFWSLKYRYLYPNNSVYGNADIVGTYKFDWEEDFGTYKQNDCLIVVDEAGIDMDNRNFAFNFTDHIDKKTGKVLHNGKQKLLCLKYHRHLGVSCLILSQWTDQDVKIRNLAQQFWVCRKTGFPWLLCVQRFESVIEVDPMTGDFRFTRKKKHTYFIFSPVIWFDFSTEAVPFELPEKDWNLVE